MRTMRFVIAVVALLGSACSYDWGSVQPLGSSNDAGNGQDAPSGPDPRQVIPVGFSCNPVSTVGCAEGLACVANIDATPAITTLTCRRSVGSTNQGQFCQDESFCTTGLVCWTSPTDTSSRTCERPCFDDRDCGGGHCDVGGSYQVPYSRITLYRCL